MLKVHIFIVGMAGAGKTSLGRKLAQNMNLRFVDTDQRVCEMLGMPSVNAIYAALGEDIFRNAETGALMELAGEDPCVVSTGGGICNDNVNVTIMKNHGVIVHIDRPLDQILSDIRTDRRPHYRCDERCHLAFTKPPPTIAWTIPRVLPSGSKT